VKVAFLTFPFIVVAFTGCVGSSSSPDFTLNSKVGSFEAVCMTHDPYSMDRLQYHGDRFSLKKGQDIPVHLAAQGFTHHDFAPHYRWRGECYDCPGTCDPQSAVLVRGIHWTITVARDVLDKAGCTRTQNYDQPCPAAFDLDGEGAHLRG
jgi:hypothetical protein